MSDMKKVTLVLSDGTKFHGKSFGYDAPVAGEVVFNTAMMGYPESLTDPSYAGQLMTLTFPLVGNYGVPPFTFEENGLPTFMESDKIYASAIIVNDYSEQYSHWNAVESLADWLKREKVPGITGIDTRELTKVLREHGVMMGKILFDDEPDNIPEANYEGVNFVDQVSCKEIIRYNEGAGKKVVLVDCGVKLHTAVNENHLLAGTLVVTDNLLAAHLVNEVYTLVVSLRDVVWFIIKENLTHHHTMLTKHLSQLTGVDACDSWHLFALQPVGKTLHCIPVAVLLAVIIHDDGRSINLVTLHEGWQTILLKSKWWHTIVAHERECKCHQLTGVRRVGQTLWISHHGCVEHNLARYRSVISKRFAMELGSIAQN